jgi:hypothetical protein
VKSKVAVVSFAFDEACDALLGVKTAEAGTTAAAAGGSALIGTVATKVLGMARSSQQ